MLLTFLKSRQHASYWWKMQVLNVADLICLRSFQEDHSQTVKLPYYFQEAKGKMNKAFSEHLYTLPQKISGLQNIHLPPKRKQTVSKEMRIKYFSNHEPVSSHKQGGENCLQFLQFLPNPPLRPCIEQESTITNIPSQNTWHELDIGHFYRSCF